VYEGNLGISEVDVFDTFDLFEPHSCVTVEEKKTKEEEGRRRSRRTHI
jgi:hypothetical protein